MTTSGGGNGDDDHQDNNDDNAAAAAAAAAKTTTMDDEEDLSVEERMTWLRERGIQIETPEERRRTQVSNLMKEADEITYVLIPADGSAPLQELSCAMPALSTIDILIDHLKPAFAATTTTDGGDTDGRNVVDIDLWRRESSSSATAAAASTLLANGPTTVSDESIRQVAQQGHVEVFSLVRATPSNHFTAVNIYLDEAGMLKRLPLNLRAAEYAVRAGFHPPPTFYGNVYLGRTTTVSGGVTRNASFRLGDDTALDAPWLLAAATDNLQSQMELHRITGRSSSSSPLPEQPRVAGTDGQTKQEEGYAWTQTEQELEVIVDHVQETRQINVKFLPRIVEVHEAGKLLVHLRLFEAIDVDGCTWTVEDSTDQSPPSGAGTTVVKRLHITMEKVDQALWPRIRD